MEYAIVTKDSRSPIEVKTGENQDLTRLKIYSPGEHKQYIDVSKNAYSCLERGFGTAREFTKKNLMNGDSKGLLVLLGTQDNLLGLVDYLDGKLMDYFGNIDGLLFDERVSELYNEMGYRDGAIAFDFKGKLLGTEIQIENIKNRGCEDRIKNNILCVKGVTPELNHHTNIGSRHSAGLFASRNDDIY